MRIKVFLKKFCTFLLSLATVIVMASCASKTSDTANSTPVPGFEGEEQSARIAGSSSIKLELSENPYIVLVNKGNKLPDNWESKVEIIDVKNSLGEELKIEKKTYEAYKKLRADLLKDGVQIELDSVYRSVAEQQEIWDAWSNDPELGPEYCEKYLAVPGYSEHHTGLAVDIFIMKNGEEIRDNDDMIADVEDFDKVHARLAEYGFILRYLKGKDDVTGYAYEPWHLRFVNDVTLAKEIESKGLTLEEYLKKQ